MTGAATGRAEAAGATTLAARARLRALADTGLRAAPDEAFERYARLVRGLLDVPAAAVSLMAVKRQFFPGAIGLPVPWQRRREITSPHPYFQRVIETASPVVLSDTRRSHVTYQQRGALEIGAYAGMPLTDRDGRVLGALCAISPVPRSWSTPPAGDIDRPRRRLLLRAAIADQPDPGRPRPAARRGVPPAPGDAGGANRNLGRDSGDRPRPHPARQAGHTATG